LKNQNILVSISSQERHETPTLESSVVKAETTVDIVTEPIKLECVDTGSDEPELRVKQNVLNVSESSSSSLIGLNHEALRK